ncbi:MULTISPECIES: YbaB/EbfC family nucleoid-associated protein [Pimelobacter]|uniref:YbaB/EbfC family nucleoid-associated protein n=1 Tax=Pimelobacter TaxID=2044 RepID=UPI001C03D71B|nr:MULTISPECIES: YbaB/EbfC family nucleoid-associated protein [Pimelobacter]MBU2693942.1 nucleoid-associated protein [Pimelobacter sp. 30-1]UUW90537.1 YbaB/EbfC family nucleoid-associated protein [Pimelobacter simplex]UUW94367.1 YbaB/EbfC family nucleoid-associated protein [Pimelobacter simplex]
MSQNPFDALAGGLGGAGGPGGFDLGALLQQAQQMQDQLQEAQQRLADATVDGTVAGGAVTVTITGSGELTAVSISPDALDGTDAEALADLGDLVVAAFRDARTKVDALAEQMLGPLAGGMPDLGGLPGQGGPGPGQLGF